MNVSVTVFGSSSNSWKSVIISESPKHEVEIRNRPTFTNQVDRSVDVLCEVNWSAAVHIEQINEKTLNMVSETIYFLSVDLIFKMLDEPKTSAPTGKR